MRVPIRYKGKTLNYVDPICGTGIVWEKQGDIQRVPEKFAPALLFYPDVFEDARAPSAQKKQPITATEFTRTLPKHQMDEEAPLVRVEQMDKQGIANYIAMNFGERVDPAAHTREQLTAMARDHIRGIYR